MNDSSAPTQSSSRAHHLLASRWVVGPAAGTLFNVSAVCAGYYVAGLLSLITQFPSSGISTVWLATPVLLAALLVVPPRTWWLYWLALLPIHVHLVVTFQGPVPLSVMLAQLGGNCALATLAAFALRGFIGAPPRLAGLRNMSAFIVVAGFALPWLVSAVVVYLFWFLGWTPDYALPWTARSLSNGVGALIATPLILWGITGGVTAVREAELRRYGEFGLLVAALLALSFAVFGDASAHPGARPALLYAPLPLLLWAAVRFETGGLCVALLVVAIQSLSNAMAGRGPFILESPVENALGLQLFLLAVAVPLLLLSALLQQHHQTLDTLRRGEAALRASYVQVRDLAGRLISAQEVERKRMARDLHDDLSQRLALLSIEIDQLPRDTMAADDLAARTRNVSDVARKIAADVHNLSYQLHPSRLETLGLVAAVEGICREVAAQHGLRVDFEHRHVPTAIRPDVALCLYRIVQEGLHNVVKHSGAHEAHVSLSGDDGVLALQIADSGVGFDGDASSRAGIGLIGMRERVNFVSGTIVIHSVPGAGTRIGVRIPVDGNK